ncbi:MAG: hypothetical protein ACK43K_13780, partial [Chitinophagales bacterium]
ERYLYIVFCLTILVDMNAQTRSKSLVKSLESTNPEKFQQIMMELKDNSYQEKSNEKPNNSAGSVQSGKLNKEVNVNENKSTTPTSAPANTSAIAHGEARTPSAAVAKNYKYKADEKSVEYYNDLRKKFEEEEKIRKEKEALLTIEKAKKEEEVKQGRRLTEDQAPQFDRFRQGEKNPVVPKTTAEEDYKSLFK